MLERPSNDITLEEVEAWLQKLVAHNEQQPLFEPAALRRGVGERWFEVCYTYPRPRLGGLRRYRSSPLATYWPLGSRQQVAFLVRALRNF